MDYLIIAIGTYLFYNLRYLLFAGLYYFICYDWFYEKLKPFKINQTMPEKKMIFKEIGWGSTVGLSYIPWMLVMTWMYQNGFTKIYLDTSAYGGPLYIGISTFLIFFLHDTYFYWVHYWCHKSKFARKYFHHHVHHIFKNPTPFAAFSTHPMESFIELGFRAIIISVLPLHPYAIGIFLFLSFVLNCLGHSGYEFFPSGYTTHPLTKFKGCSTHHYIHHKYGNCHYSLYFSWWDKVMGTEHPDYHKMFEDRAKHNPIKILVSQEHAPVK